MCWQWGPLPAQAGAPPGVASTAVAPGAAANPCVLRPPPPAGASYALTAAGLSGNVTHDSLALGAIFSSSDSVAALQVLEQDAQPMLYSLVFGEGVVNDATAIVLLRAVSGIRCAGGQAAGPWGQTGLWGGQQGCGTCRPVQPCAPACVRTHLPTRPPASCSTDSQLNGATLALIALNFARLFVLSLLLGVGVGLFSAVLVKRTFAEHHSTGAGAAG